MMYHMQGDSWFVDITGDKISLVFVKGKIHINLSVISVF